MYEAVHATAHRLLIGMPEAVAIWLVLLLVAVAALGALSLPDPRVLLVVHAVRRAARCAARRAGGSRPKPRPAEEATRCAEEIALASERAAVTADRRRDEWLAAQRAVEAAWAAFEDADRRVRRVTEATAFPPPKTGRTPTEYAERERNLHRIVEHAYQCGELGVDQWYRARAHRDGFDPTLDPFAQEIVLWQAVRAHRLREYLAASAQEREAWRTADVAAAARRSLRDEALVAARYAERLQRRADERAGRPRGSATPAAGSRVAAAN